MTFPERKTALPFAQKLLLLVFTCCYLAGCAASAGQAQTGAAVAGQPIPADTATVLPAGTTLQAHTAAGRISIAAGPDSLRTFNWDNARRRVAARPRTELFPGTTAPGLHFDGQPVAWQPHNGIDKVRYEENVRSFQDATDLSTWVQIRRLYFSYNDQGLAVGWKRDGDTLHVEVWQFLINGEEPTTLPGADNAAVQLLPAPGA